MLFRSYTRDDGGKAEPDTATASTLTWKAVTVQPGQVVTFTVEETKHFQDFKPRVVGEFELAQPGRKTLQVVPTRKPGVAVMDLRQVRLLPAQ